MSVVPASPPLTFAQCAALARAQIDNPAWSLGPPAALVAAVVSAHRRSGAPAAEFATAVGQVDASDLDAWSMGADPRTGEIWPDLSVALARLRLGVSAAPPPPAPAPMGDEPPRGGLWEWLGGKAPPSALPRGRVGGMLRTLARLGRTPAVLDAVMAEIGTGHPRGEGCGRRVCRAKVAALFALRPDDAREAGADLAAWGAHPTARSLAGRPPQRRVAPAKVLPQPTASPGSPALPVDLQAEGPADDGAIVLRLTVRPGDALYAQAAAALRSRLGA